MGLTRCDQRVVTVVRLGELTNVNRLEPSASPCLRRSDNGQFLDETWCDILSPRSTQRAERVYLPALRAAPSVSHS